MVPQARSHLGEQSLSIHLIQQPNATLQKQSSHEGHVCVRCNQVDHPSNMPATGLKLTETGHGRRHGEEGGGALSGERHHAKIMCHKNTSSPVQEAYSLGARLT